MQIIKKKECLCRDIHRGDGRRGFLRRYQGGGANGAFARKERPLGGGKKKSSFQGKKRERRSHAPRERGGRESEDMLSLQEGAKGVESLKSVLVRAGLERGPARLGGEEKTGEREGGQNKRVYFLEEKKNHSFPYGEGGTSDARSSEGKEHPTSNENPLKWEEGEKSLTRKEGFHTPSPTQKEKRIPSLLGESPHFLREKEIMFLSSSQRKKKGRRMLFMLVKIKRG